MQKKDTARVRVLARQLGHPLEEELVLQRFLTVSTQEQHKLRVYQDEESVLG